MNVVSYRASIAFHARARPGKARSFPVAHASSSRRFTSSDAFAARSASFGGAKLHRSSHVAERGDATRGGANAVAAPRISPTRGSVVVAHGLPIPIVGGLFSAPVLAVMYVFVAIRFALNYDKTSFTEKNKAMMIGLWPILAVTSASFRENLAKATMG